MIAVGDMELEFVDFFDWGRFGYWDLQYFLVRVAGTVKYPDLIGRDAVLGADSAQVICRV